MKKSQSFPLSSVIAILVSSGSMRFAIIFFDHPAMMQNLLNERDDGTFFFVPSADGEPLHAQAAPAGA